MVCPERPVTALTVSLVYLLALFGSYCQMAPAMAGAARAWDVVSGLKYKLTTTLLFSEAAPSKTSGDVGLRLTGELNVTAVWQQPTDHDTFLLRIQLLSPQLWIKSRRAPEPEGFVEHSSRVDSVSEQPVLLLWRHGEIVSIYMDPSETVSSANLKRGLASFFQYKVFDGEFQERDASGLCNVTYHSTGPQSILKEKTYCEHITDLSKKQHPNPLFGVKVASVHHASYKLSHYLLPFSVHVKESHNMTLSARPEVGTIVTSEGILEEISGALTPNRVQANTLQEAIAALQPGFVKTNIELQLEPATCPSGGCQTLEQAIEEHRSALENTVLGTGKSAAAFNKLLPLVKSASSEELLRILKSPRYRQIKPQLLDLIGCSSTMAGHLAAMKVLRQDEVGDDTERYLWALSLSPTPDADIAKDVLKRSEETMQNDKVSETTALTAAAIARHLGSPAAVEKARVSLEIGLDSCTGEECKLKFLRALRNLRSKASIPTLLKFATSGNKAITVAAWRALAALPKDSVTNEMKTAARRVFYQIGGPKRDSSARTVALDIILENNPSKEDIHGLVEFLAASDPAYEIRKYLSQRLEQVSKKDAQFAKNLNEVLMEFGQRVINYNVLAQRGLSTAFTRDFLTSADSNGTLVTVQEIYSGILKRGTVDVVLEVDDHAEALFSLGLFAGGLGSFVSTSSQEDGQEDEPVTAGMEVDFQGVSIRPFVFFSGQGELMGHVWSGAASERTPAFQILSSVHSYSEYIRLQSGMIAEIDVQGAVSFDLAGQIQLSLWSRNAQSLVDLKAGVVIQGGSKVRSDFVQSMAEFSMTTEPKLELATDVDFSGPMQSLCMRLSQPSNVVKYQVYKVERVAGSRHKLRKTRRMRVHNPGRSYHLNRKNNEMCSKVIEAL